MDHLGPVLRSYDHVQDETDADRAATTAARSAATAQWEGERGSR